MKRITQLVVGILILALVTGCTTSSVTLTTQQVQNLSYMSGYTTMSIYLVAKKPEVSKVVTFQHDIQLIQSVLSTNPTSTSTQNITALVSAFVAQTPTDSDTAILLNAMVPPIIVATQALIDDYTNSQPASDQIKTIQMATVCALGGISNACDAYIMAVSNPPPPTPVIPPPLPVGPALKVDLLWPTTPSPFDTLRVAPQPLGVYTYRVSFIPIPLYILPILV
jgi:hypothetical protein